MSSFRSLSGNGGMDSLSLTVPLTPHVGLGLGSGAAGVAGAASSSGPAEVRLAGVDTKEKMYEPKQRKKLVRVLTVVAYLFFVSLAAAMLSLYYIKDATSDCDDAERFALQPTKNSQRCSQVGWDIASALGC
ncbi:Putative transmembrane protein INAFM2 [Frankliniella fusca]|uniref:Transmembrane protein INAFM2 n=1 Tax=Frankliniella fusca TaxID=407009 RepID=A0AAE1GST4_9NEOP|nr:Putative transmembrane protein INAFM2 [Frankliniella fusca]